MAGFIGPEWSAGEEYSVVGDAQHLPDYLIPQVPDLEHEYRWLVNVSWQWNGTGPVMWSTVEVVSAENETKEEILAAALVNAVELVGGSPKAGLRGGGGIPVLTGDAVISWAARR